jgi:YidC/Oxa1 family membrane protein insertase
VIGKARIGSAEIIREISIDAVTGKVQNEIKVTNADANYKGFYLVLPEEIRPVASSGFLMPALSTHELVFSHQGKAHRMNLTSDKTDELVVTKPEVTMAGFSHQYFAQAVVDQSTILPRLEYKKLSPELVTATLLYQPATITPEMKFSWISFAGGKSLSQIESIHADLGQLVDLGIFGVVGKLLLKFLLMIHAWIGNWGLAIVFLTILVRLAVLPFNLAAYKSMKKMQIIQPSLAAIRTKYKDDPTAMNRESMALMKENKVNPLGGCLPMLLQMPVFFALYQVLGQSIELYQAPFMLWIKDLSLRDPLFVLPVIMAVTMFLQQKLTPTNMDPAQAKIMQWMPVIFAVFTLSLPSGLTLYLSVSTLFAVIQQKIFMIPTKQKATN